MSVLFWIDFFGGVLFRGLVWFGRVIWVSTGKFGGY